MFLITGCRGKNSVEWNVVEAKDGSFSIKMPGKPKYKSENVTIAQNTTIGITIYELITKHINYTAGYSEYPRGFLRTMGKNAKEIFDKAQQATINKFGGKVLSEEDLTSKGFPHRIVNVFLFSANHFLCLLVAGRV